MHQPRPRGQAVYGREPTEEDSAAVELLARRLTNLKKISGVSSLRMVRTLPDGGYVIAQDMGGVFRCIIHKPEDPPDIPEFDGVAQDYVPMLFSGVVSKPVLRGEEGAGVRLTQQARLRLSGYGERDLPPDRAELQRFRIRYHSRFWEFEPKISGVMFYTQYAQLRPTWYSGAMAEVMQVVGGYGRQDFDSLPETELERARMTFPWEVQQQIRREMGNLRLPGYSGIPPRTGQMLYDYKFHATNGVGFDTGGKPWLIQIGRDGVWAMPLPLVPATTTQAFRDYIETKGDSEIKAILDRFGGMPSGETFPTRREDFEAWRRAGVIVEICDTADFYDHIAYASACGWSFNAKGAEAYNTCYDYDEQEGVGYGLTFKLKLSLNAAPNEGKLPQSFDLEDPDSARLLDRYLSGLYQRLSSNKARSLAIKYKIRRVNVQDILARAVGDGPGVPVIDFKKELEYWDALELEPIAAHTGEMREVGRGWLYHPAKFEFQPQIKYPEPFQGGCVSHNFLPLMHGRNKNPNCDTIMFCYYVEDDLKVVKYFRDGRSYQREVESDYEPCMTVGSWTRREYNSATTLTEGFYTSDIDDREPVTEDETLTEMVGEDLGYDAVPAFEFDYFFAMQGSMWRNRYFSRETKTTTSEGRRLNSATCIPYFCRNALLYAHQEHTIGGSVTETGKRLAVRDPWSYRYWTYDFIWAWRGGSGGMGGSPAPKNGSPVWVGKQNYNPGPCSDFADQGPWVPGLPADYTWLIHPNRHEWNHSGGGGAPPYTDYYRFNQEPGESKGRLDFSIYRTPRGVHDSIPASFYFHGSPDAYGNVFYRDACQIVFGERDYVNISETVNGSRKRWGNTRLADHKSAHHFIGVINE